MSNLVFSLNATMPVFLLMVLGYILHCTGLIDDRFASQMNSFVFKISLPFLLFIQLATTDFVKAWDTRFVLFCFFTTLASILLVSLVSLYIKQKDLRGEFIQAAYRSSAAILGIAYISNIYGNAGMAPLMIVGAVPLYNIMAVVVLSVTDQSTAADNDRSALIRKTLLGIIRNPIIIGVVAGFLWSVAGLPMAKIPQTFFQDVGATATPLGLIAMGASVDFKKVGAQLKNALVASFFKLIGLAAIFVPLAIALGFRNEKLVAILIMLTSATTVSSFVMARNMHHEGVLTSNAVAITTVLSSFTITFWIYLLRSGGFI